MTQKQQRPGGNRGATTTNQPLHSNSAASQRQRLEEALRQSKAGLSTVEIRRDLDIMMPGTRIWELRWNHGLNIQTIDCVDTTEAGGEHSVARYVLMSGVWQGDAA